MAAREVIQDEGGNRREGSRWIGQAPDPQEVADWFVANGKFHGLAPEDYVAGVVLISQVEKQTTQTDSGMIVDVQRLVHVPYVKVETRVAFFWDLCARKSWVGEINPVEYDRPVAAGMPPGTFSAHLPPGFFRTPARYVTDAGVREVDFISCAQRVLITKTVKGVKSIVRQPSSGTKGVPMLDRWGKPDPHAIMRAETGAVGRALGMAGILTLPGSGVITAEDMQEMLDRGGIPLGGAPEAEPQLPDEPAAAAVDIGGRIRELISRLRSESPAKLEEVNLWAAERQIDVSTPQESQLRALLGFLERKVAELDA